jgi:hypothetical protein
MRRRRAPTESASVSLFPFLAVLICTMGSLILLLVVIARQARLQASQVSTVAQSTMTDLQRAWDFLHERLATLRNLRASADDELSQRRAALRELATRSQQLEAELAELERARDLLKHKRDSSESEPELQQLTGRIAQLQKQLAEARRSAQSPSPSYAIVPYTGPNQTRRRPIYIECRRDRIVLQPEGVVLTERDFEGPLDNSNALASAVRAAEQYLGRNSQSNLREAGEPYPLLLVRPDGINSYYVARAALRSWGSDFGYELIDEDWQLDFKGPDAGLASVEAKAVEDARGRQQFLGYAGSGIGGSGAFRGGSPGTKGSFAQGGDDPPASGFRVLPDGRVVRDSSSRGSALKPRSGGSRLSRYAEITGSGAPGNTSDVAAATPSAGRRLEDRLSEAESAGQSSARNEGNPGPPAQSSSAASAGQPSLGPANVGTPAQASNAGRASFGSGSPSDVAVASDQQGPRILPQQLFGQHHAKEAGTPSLAESQGKNWALPDSSRGSIPVMRPIHVECRDDRIVILPEFPGGPGQREIPFAGRTTNAVSSLITAIWDRMDGWGIAGKGMYWRPELHVRTTPEGAARLAELKALLADSGIVIVERPATTARRERY